MCKCNKNLRLKSPLKVNRPLEFIWSTVTLTLPSFEERGGDTYLYPIRPGLFSCWLGPGSSEAQMPKIKVNINWLKLNFAWVIISIKAFLMQNLRLIALLVLEILRHKIFLKWREPVIRFDYLHPENGFNFKKDEFLCPELFFSTQNWPPCQFQKFSSRGKFFHFQNFWDVSMTKEQQQPPWLINFAKIWSECALRIKTKSHQVSASWSKRFLIVSCEFGHQGLWASPPGPDRVKSDF